MGKNTAIGIVKNNHAVECLLAWYAVYIANAIRNIVTEIIIIAYIIIAAVSESLISFCLSRVSLLYILYAIPSIIIVYFYYNIQHN